MKKFAAILLGLSLLSTSTGCYYGWPFGYGYYQGGNNFGGPYNQYGVPQGTPQGTFNPPPTVVPQSSFYQPYNGFQSAMNPVFAPPVMAFGPTMFQTNPNRVATGPMESLPTY